MENLAEAFPDEIERCRELLDAYKEIGPAGTFGVIMIKKDIDEAIKALASGDVVRMIRAYKTLKECS